MLNFFKEIRGVEVFMSEKKNGNMKLFSFNFEFNRKKYLEKIGLRYENLISAKLEHGNNVEIIEDNNKKFVNYCDGLLTQNPNIILSVTSADCLPIFLFDPIKKVVGILHCGWRSIASGIIEKALNKIKINFKSDLKNILVGIGPGIQKCHFEVGEEFLKNFRGYEKFIFIKNSKKYFDLKGVIIDKLDLAGIKNNNIKTNRLCTYCDKNLYSRRRDKINKEGDIQAMIAGIKIKN